MEIKYIPESVRTLLFLVACAQTDSAAAQMARTARLPARLGCVHRVASLREPEKPGKININNSEFLVKHFSSTRSFCIRLVPSSAPGYGLWDSHVCAFRYYSGSISLCPIVSPARLADVGLLPPLRLLLPNTMSTMVCCASLYPLHLPPSLAPQLPPLPLPPLIPASHTNDAIPRQTLHKSFSRLPKPRNPKSNKQRQPT